MSEILTYRMAKSEDTTQIALLHADSWRRTYRGLFSDAFLDNDADIERRQTWRKRLSCKNTDQFVFVAEDTDAIRGFICAYGNEDATWGSLIDNLHVDASFKQQRIGTNLMHHAFAWLAQHFPDVPVYLWVMENNHTARRFYEKLGATNAGVIDKPNPRANLPTCKI